MDPSAAPARRLPSVSVPQLSVSALIAVAAAVELSRLVSSHAPSGVYLGWAAAVIGAAMTWWATWPGLAVAAVAPILTGAFGWDPIVEWSISVFLAFSVTVRRGRPVLVAAVIAVPAVAGILLGTPAASRSTDAFAVVIAAAAAVGIGMSARAQRRLREVLEQRAQEAQATKEAEAERRVAEERLRIARDLHDVIGHEIAVVSMQLGIAEVSLPDDGAQQTREALQIAREGVRGVLTQAQRILAILRGHDAAEPTEPTPGLDAVPGLVAAFRSAGLELQDRLELAGVRLDQGAGLAAYRVVQEALTNASRYARGPVTLTATRTGDALTILVRNRRAVGAPSFGSGLGLVGLRERVDAAGGTVEVEAHGIVFALTARLPLLVEKR